MKIILVLMSVCFVWGMAMYDTTAAELPLGTQKTDCRNCLAKYENGMLSIVHFYDNEKVQQLKKLQTLGYLQGSDNLVAQLIIPNQKFAGPEISVKVMIDLVTNGPDSAQYIIIALVDESDREIAREQILPDRYTELIRNKSFLSAKLKTWGRKKGSVVFKFAGIKHVRISKIDVE